MEDAFPALSPHQPRRAPESIQVRRVRRGADVRQVEKAAGDTMRARNTVIGLALAALAATSIAAQSPASAPRSAGATAGQAPPSTVKPAAALRTSDGKPDLQGIWTNATITPLERPQNVKNLVLSEEEAARMEKTVVD